MTARPRSTEVRRGRTFLSQTLPSPSLSLSFSVSSTSRERHFTAHSQVGHSNLCPQRNVEPLCNENKNLLLAPPPAPHAARTARHSSCVVQRAYSAPVVGETNLQRPSIAEPGLGFAWSRFVQGSAKSNTRASFCFCFSSQCHPDLFFSLGPRERVPA